MGLGSLGGGVATTRWLVGQGTQVTVTDLKTRRRLADSILALGTAAKNVRFVLGGHRDEDFRTHDYVVVNPGVPKESPFLTTAKRAGTPIVNDAVLFFEFLPKENPIIAVTGTRGKTTTTNWIAHLLRARWPQVQAAGNTPENPLLKELDRLKKYPGTPAVLELSSWQLEYLPAARGRAPDVAVITNLYPDHMNRYASMREYAAAKANIFGKQRPGQITILDGTASAALGRRRLPAKQLLFSAADAGKWSARAATLGEHNVYNFAAALLAARLACKMFPPKRPITDREIIRSAAGLRRALPPFRQETILETEKLLVINDSASTSPEAAIMALRRFTDVALAKKLPFYFITGGTDKNLSYDKLAHALRAAARLFAAKRLGFHIYLLEGSATEKILGALRAKKPKNFDGATFKDLRAIMRAIRGRLPDGGQGVVVFSPGAASFEKFKNEFDRGERFARLADMLL